MLTTYWKLKMLLKKSHILILKKLWQLEWVSWWMQDLTEIHFKYFPHTKGYTYISLSRWLKEYLIQGSVVEANYSKMKVHSRRSLGIKTLS